MWKKIIKKILSNINLLNFTTSNRFIFLYHDISEINERHHSPLYSTSIKQFKKHLELLNKIFKIIPLEELVSKKDLSSNYNYASITFDDGFYSILKNADPILKSYNNSYTIFINGCAVISNQNWITNLQINKEDKFYNEKITLLSNIKNIENNDIINTVINKGKFNELFKDNYKINNSDRKIFLNKDDIQYLVNKKVSIQDHSFDHFVINKCNNNLLVNQINENKKIIKEITANNPKHFAIPFGKKIHYNQRNILSILSQGHKYIYTTNPNKFKSKDIIKKKFLYPRIGLTNQNNNELLFFVNRAVLKNYDI